MVQPASLLNTLATEIADFGLISRQQPPLTLNESLALIERRTKILRDFYIELGVVGNKVDALSDIKWGDITGLITDQLDLMNYVNSLPVSTFTNDIGYITLAEVPLFNSDFDGGSPTDVHLITQKFDGGTL